MASNPYIGPPVPPRNPRPSPSSQKPGAPPINNPYSDFKPASNDPRTSSTQSLIPAESHRHTYDKRRLLLIYIHGFMGNETSFRSFPAHVHNLVTITLAESHVVHTKIYPRYASRREIGQVAEDFSRWLTPHETDDTDVILLSHSMGGLVSAEVTLLPAANPAPGHTFRHNIIGGVNFDVPFLGMHPGVISSGLGSIFRPAIEPPANEPQDIDGGPISPASTHTTDSQSTYQSSTSGRPSRHDTLFEPPADPNFNPKFNNDVVLPVRKGWKNAMHFMNKHSNSLRQATKQLVKSHIEFGGAMADYSGLRNRYLRIRALEDEDAEARKKLTKLAQAPPRIRFVNYYTASTGRPKLQKPPSERSGSRSRSGSRESRRDLRPGTSLGTSVKDLRLNTPPRSRSRSKSPRISIEEHIGDQIVHKEKIDLSPDHDDDHLSPMNHAEPMALSSADEESDAESHVEIGSPIDSIDSLTSTAVDAILPTHHHVQLPNLPPIPHAPMEPRPLDLTPYPDKEARKIAQKEHDRQMRSWKQAVKDREEAVRDREKLEAKIRKAAAKEILKKRKEEQNTKSAEEKKEKQKERDAEEKKEREEWEEEKKRRGKEVATTGTEASINAATESIRTTDMDNASVQEREADSEENKKPKKDRKFCVLPKKVDGVRDPTWVRVYMKDMDEVSAHCGLFVLSDTYERLVGDVGDRIEEWVRDEMTRRLVEDIGRV